MNKTLKQLITIASLTLGLLLSWSASAATTTTDQSISVTEDVPKSFTVRATGSRGETFAFGVSAPSHGTATVSGSTVTYTPAANYNGSDRFTYTAFGSTGQNSSATVNVTVSSVNDSPIFSVTNPVNTLENTAVVFNVSATDVDGDSLSYTAGATTGGRITVDERTGAVEFVPTSNFTGEGSATVRVSDSRSSVTQTVSVNIQNINYTPTATGEAVATNEDTARALVLDGDDQDADDTLIYTIITAPQHGTVSLYENLATYAPAANYSGTDSFQFSVSDGQAVSNVATIDLTISAVNDLPVANDQQVTLEKNLRSNLTISASDIDSTELTYQIPQYTEHGSITSIDGTSFQYQPDEDYTGTDTINFTVRDGQLADTGTVTVTVQTSHGQPANDAGTIAWQYDLGERTVSAAPVFASGNIYFGTYQNGADIYTFNSTGSLLGTLYIGMHVESAIAAWGNQLFVNTVGTGDSADNTTIAGYNATQRRGTMVFARDADGLLASTPTCVSTAEDSGADNSVAFNESRSRFYRTEVKYPGSSATAHLTSNSTIDCATYESADLPGWSFASPLFYPNFTTSSQEDGLVIVGTEADNSTGMLLAYRVDADGDLNTTPIWTLASESEFARGAVPILDLDDGTIFAATKGGNVYSINPNTGAVNWEINVGGSGFSTLTVGHDNRTIYILNGGVLNALDATNGNIRWTVALSSNSGVAYVGNTGVIYALGEEKLVALNEAGHELWSLPVPEETVYGYMGMNPVNGQLVFAAGNTLYSVKTESTGYSATSDFPAVRADSANTGLPHTHAYDNGSGSGTGIVELPDPRLNTVETSEFCNQNGVSLLADVYFPATNPDYGIIVVHGGGWTRGSRTDFAAETQQFLDAGYLVMSIDYRLAPTYKFPAQIEDVKCAVRYLRANADNYGINPEQIAMFGGSAGGHLATLAGTSTNPAWEVGSYLGVSSDVQVVGAYYPLTDLTTTYAGFNKNIMRNVFGTSDLSQSIFTEASPVQNLTADDATTLIIHGSADDLVPVSFSQTYVNQSNAAGVSAELITINGANHGFGGTTPDDLDGIRQSMVSFFDTKLQ